MIAYRPMAASGFFLCLSSAGILLSLQALARAEDVDAGKLVGVWVLRKVNKKETSLPIEFEFTKDGKAHYAVGDSKSQGTYTVDGDKLMVRMTGPKGKIARSTISTIVKLTDEILVTKSGRDESEYKKKESKK